jgi:ribosomal protein L15
MKPKNEHAQALAKLSHRKPSEKRRHNSRENGKKGGRPVSWSKAPKKGMKNPKAELFRYTVVRLEDKAERFTNRKPVVENVDFMVWDNVKNCEAGTKNPLQRKRIRK